MNKFVHTYNYKLIYVFSMPYETHKGLLKIGEATIKTASNLAELLPNSHQLNQAAKLRIEQYTGTASTQYKLEYTELATLNVDGYLMPFKDKDVHAVLMNSRIHKVQPNGSTGNEWFETNLETVKNAIKAVKEGKSSLDSNKIYKDTTITPIDFRDEQLDAIEKTIKTFKKTNEMLWYAKMRFGKTLTALEVVRRSQYRRVIIVTHRPVVNDSWGTDFGKIFFSENSEHPYNYEDKTKDSSYTIDEKTDSENDTKIRKLDNDGSYFLYFASIQDLRGSKLVGGKFNKNNAVFALNWDLIIIDEAHEGTQTELGDNVIKALRKENTKVLALSGTPFNLLGQYAEEDVYTWDYVMEQKKKDEWDLLHKGDHNPYADLPKMHIYTYDLGEKLKKYVSDEYDTKAFNFREFFRVWYKGPNSKRQLPPHATEGNFVHENDVKSFLDLLAKDDPDSIYPFSNPEYRDMFRHTLWMVPGVKEATALEGMLRKHLVFCHFGIANVAGEGDTYEKDHYKDALEKVRKTIKENEYSITLSCGKLTTGVTVKEWTAVLMLSGSYSTAAAQYMQTIFRVQSAGEIDGKQKTDCFVFDFAPDRTLKVLTETVHLSRKPGKSQEKRRQAMTDFLNYCPVIAVQGSKMKSYSVNSMMEQVKQIYAERAVNSGFDDESIYNDELLKLDNIDATKFNNLKDIIGKTKAEKKKDSVVVNGQGLTDEQIEHIDDGDGGDVAPHNPLTPEQIAERLAKKQAKEARKKAIDILRGISIRMPLLIYGADVSIDEDIDINRFVDLVDDTSWEEFMPTGVTKKIFADFTKYYDRDVFIAAGKRIRKLAAAADKETPTNRVKLITEIFRHFKNPDKETVLTPWRVVNMHMSDTLGGWCFFNENFEDDTSEVKKRLEQPRFVDNDTVTKDVFRGDTKILEINSKTGLYPLYVAYSCYRQKLEGTTDEDWEPQDLQEFWNDTLQNNVYVICKTPMAKSITIRTLAGYSKGQVNAHYFDDLVNQLKNIKDSFKKRVLKESYWKKGDGIMKFDAIVGNPPYQGINHSQIYPFFYKAAIDLGESVSMIFPIGWQQPRNANNLKVLNNQETKEDKQIVKINNLQNVFPGISGAEWVNIVFWKKGYDNGLDGKQMLYTNSKNPIAVHFEWDMDAIQKPIEIQILNEAVTKHPDFISLQTKMSMSKPYGIRKDVFTEFKKYNLPEMQETRLKHNDILIYGSKENIRYVPLDYPFPKISERLKKYKVLVGSAWGNMSENTGLGGAYANVIIAGPNEACTETYQESGSFDNYDAAEKQAKYLLTKFARACLYVNKLSQMSTQAWGAVPVQNFSEDWWDLSIKQIDEKLFEKYNLPENISSYIRKNIQTKSESNIVNYKGIIPKSDLQISYDDYVAYLLKKYGPCKHDYFKDTACTQKNPLISRTNEGLYCHHIDEDKAIMLCNDKYAATNPFDCQKANRLVYCNLLEHLILHVKIAENPNKQENQGELLGIGGAINFICKDLNEIYSEKEIADEWRKKVADAVKDDFDEYINILRYFWKVVESNPLYKVIVTKEMLCVDWDNNVNQTILNALNEIDE